MWAIPCKKKLKCKGAEWGKKLRSRLDTTRRFSWGAFARCSPSLRPHGVLGTLFKLLTSCYSRNDTQATGEIIFLLSFFSCRLTYLTNWTNAKLTDVNICICGHGLLTALRELSELNNVLMYLDAPRQEQITRATELVWINLSTENLQGKTHHNMFTFFNHKATEWSLFGEWVITAVLLCLVSVCRKMSARQSKQHDDQPLSRLSVGTNAAFKCRRKHCNYTFAAHNRPE